VPWRSASELSTLRLKRPERLVRPDAKEAIFFFPDGGANDDCSQALGLKIFWVHTYQSVPRPNQPYLTRMRRDAAA